MIAYFSRTGTRRQLEVLRACGFRCLVSASGVLRHEGFRYALDNGAWTAHTQGRPFDVAAFERAVGLLGAGADWIVAPDIVMGGPPSLAMSLPWISRLLPVAPVLIPVQDGMTVDDVAPHLSDRVGIFVGGSSEWKDSTMADWSRLARRHGAYCHVGRVNTRRRIQLCAAAAVDSFDGSGVSKFAMHVPKVDGWMRQTNLLALVADA